MAQVSNHKIAENLLLNGRFHDRLIWVHEWEAFLYSEGAYWRVATDNELATQVLAGLPEIGVDVNVSDARLLDIVALMKRICPHSVTTPRERYLAFTDGYYDMLDGRFVPFGGVDPFVDGVAFIAYPFPFPQGPVPTPVFDRFLQTSLVFKDDTSAHDPALATLVKEMMGYVLMPSMEGAAAFFFFGAGKNGKSKLADLTRMLVGNRLSSAMTLESLTANRFSASYLVGKKLNVCNEDESQYLASDKFKAVVSGEYITAERKYGATFNFSPIAKYVFCTNSAPRFDGLNYGLKRRVKIIPFYKQITDAEKDVRLGEKLAAELPGIVRFAIDGMERLAGRKYEFSDQESASVREEMEEFENALSSAVRFMRETYAPDPLGEVSNSLIYAEYVEWCKQNGCKPMNSLNFHKDICRNMGIDSKVKRSASGLIRVKPVAPINDTPL